MITHGKHLLIKDASLSLNVLQASNSSVEEKHPFILLYGTVLITNLLLGKLPEVLLPEFEKEGLIDNITSFLKLLHQDKRVEEYNEDEDLEMISQIDNTGTGLSFFSRSKIYHTHENSDFDENANFSDGDENATDNDVDDDEDEDEEDYNEEGNEVERNEISDAEDSDIEHDHTHPRGVRSGRGCKVLPVIDYSVTGDGAYIVSMEIILKVLIRNCTEIERDYEHFKKTMKFEVSESFQELEKLLKMFSSIDVKTFNDNKDTWMEIWSRFGKIIISDNDKNKSISSFELISSGFIEKLSQLFDSEHAFEGSNCLKLFKYLFCSNSSPLGSNENLPIVVLVSKLEEALTRSESFEIVSSGTSLGGSSNVVASRASSMAKQIKIKLISDDSSIGEQNSQMMVMVHAIATFKSLNGFMKSRIGGLRGLMKALISSANAAASGSGGSNIRTNDRDPEDREFYIEFSINNEVIPSETTIYGAIYRSLQTTPNDLISPNQVWLSGPHEVHFKRVWGTAPTVVEEEIYPKDSNYDECMDILGDSTTIDILQLLKVFYKLNSSVENAGASDALFLNYKLTAKLNRQLEEPLIVASGTLPGWSVYITRNFPFLFPLDTRLFFLQTTSFGYSRLIHQWQIRSRRDDEPTNGSGSIGGRGSSSSNALQLGRPVRHKLRVSRRRILQGAMKILETYGSIPGLLEIEYFDEVGTGLGPTLEFYSLVSKEFSRSLLYMWRDDSAADVGNTSGVERNGSNGDAFIVNNELENAGIDEKYVDSPLGLFPRPLSKDSKHYKKNLYMFSTLGKFIARALLDSRIIDFAFNPLFFEICNLCEYKDDGTDNTSAGTAAAAENNDGIFKNFSRSAKIDYVKLVDPVLAKSLIHLNKYLVEYEEIDKLALKNGW
ncbi:unnamed protein product [[Candida] boidinii]|nr:unnamed protein product [[Candida] boidinii]